MPGPPHHPTRTSVICPLKQCIFHEEDEGPRAFCYHPDKPMHMRVEPCPFYRVDWKKARQSVAQR